MNNVMIDLETLATTPDAAIVSIGACYFNIEAGEIGETFHAVMKWEEVFEQERRIDPETIKWWMKQSDEARLGIIEGGAYLSTILDHFSAWLGEDACPWGNGATFDISILENAYAQYDIELPWKFYRVRDMRTMTMLAHDMGYKYTENNPRQGTLHNALDDAVHQAKVVSDIYIRLMG